MLIFITIAVFLEGQMGEAWDPANRAMPFCSDIGEQRAEKCSVHCCVVETY
jgi:hypothetical protein